jgi:hypothetical protein
MSSKDQMRPLRAAREVLNDWVPELALKLGRPEVEVRESGLSAYDFSPACAVEVRYPFGCTHKISFAFAVIRPQAGLAAVFSEHAGYLEFDLIEDCVVAEIREDAYRHDQSS